MLHAVAPGRVGTIPIPPTIRYSARAFSVTPAIASVVTIYKFGALAVVLVPIAVVASTLIGESRSRHRKHEH